MGITTTIVADLAIIALAVMIIADVLHLPEIIMTGIGTVARPHALVDRPLTTMVRPEAGMLTMGMILVRCRPVVAMILMHI